MEFVMLSTHTMEFVMLSTHTKACKPPHDSTRGEATLGALLHKPQMGAKARRHLAPGGGGGHYIVVPPMLKPRIGVKARRYVDTRGSVVRASQGGPHTTPGFCNSHSCPRQRTMSHAMDTTKPGHASHAGRPSCPMLNVVGSKHVARTQTQGLYWCATCLSCCTVVDT
jgi:hypothetical protein